MKIRDLQADEIEVRVQSAKQNGVILLLYKNARVDMAILDEVFGPMNWQRSHTRDNQNCIVSVWDENKKCWVSKEDTGTESNTEAEKGLASDSFKRRCFNWGIGRELYTAPFIWVSADKCNMKSYTANGKTVYKCDDKFSVKDIQIKGKQITGLTIYNESKKCEAFAFPAKGQKQQVKGTAPEYKCAVCGKPFVDTEYNGKVYSAKSQYESALKNRGGAYCKECYEKMGK